MWNNKDGIFVCIYIVCYKFCMYTQCTLLWSDTIGNIQQYLCVRGMAFILIFMILIDYFYITILNTYIYNINKWQWYWSIR